MDAGQERHPGSSTLSLTLLCVMVRIVVVDDDNYENDCDEEIEDDKHNIEIDIYEEILKAVKELKDKRN